MLSDYNEEMTNLDKYVEEKSKAKIESLNMLLKFYDELNNIEKAEKVRLAKENARNQEKWVLEHNKKYSQRIEYRHQPDLFEERKNNGII